MIELVDILKHIKKTHIDQSYKILRALFTIIPIVVAFYTIRSSINGYLESNTRINKFLNETNNSSYSKQSDDSKMASLKDLDVIVEKNIFGPFTQPTPIGSNVATKPVVKTPLTLVGTYVGDEEVSSAIIEDTKKAIQDVFLINETIFGEAKLLSVHSDYVEIDRNGEKEILKLEEGSLTSGTQTAGGGTATSGGEIVVAEADVDNALSNLPLLLTELRAVPYFKDGQAVGLRLFAIKQGSLFEKIGLKNGDILKTINGNSMGDFTQAVKLFEKLKAERNLKVNLERNREEQEYSYVIK